MSKQTKIINGVEYTLDEYGDYRSYNKEGRLHSFNDQPSVIYSNDAKQWNRDGFIHRDNDKPAIIWTDGTKEWRKNGLLHRGNDKPAVIYADDKKAWYVNNKNQPDKYFVCIYVRKNKQYKKFFATELQAKQFESEMLAKGLCAWVIENKGD